MSMLAEKKRKTKWVINPTKKPLWNSDSNGIKLGKELMEKMGWCAGKGLGANEQGIREPLKVSYKNDTKGMGFKGNDDQWIEHQDEFNYFLNQLRNNDESSAVKPSDAEKTEVKSLEEKSKVSKARVHYQKFTRGKDLSKYSENDLACILGTNKAKNKDTKSEEAVQEDSKTNGNYETNFGVTTINSGSIQDYFKKKWIFQNGIRSKPDVVDEGAENISNENSSSLGYEAEDYQVNDKKHSKKSKIRLSSMDVETTMSQSDELEKKVKKKKKREKDLIPEEEPEEKKIKKSDFDVINDISVEEADCSSKKKRRSKDIHVRSENDGNILETDNEELGNSMNKKRKKIYAESTFQDSPVTEEFHDLNDTELNHKKSKRKEKREKIKENLENEDVCGIQGTPNGVGGKEENLPFETEAVLKKKKKKSKNEKYFENDGMEDKVSHYNSMEVINNHNEQLASCSETKKKKKKDKNKQSGENEVAESIENSVSQIVHSKVDEINIECANEGEFTPAMESVKKKRKESKGKVMEEEFMAIKSSQENVNEIEKISGSELVKQKKKNKEKEPVQIEDIENTKGEAATEMESVKKKKKKDGQSVEVDAIEGAIGVETVSEMESVKKKKNKKDKEKDLDQIEVDGLEKEVEVTSEAESVKKKKKKDKEKELIQMEGAEEVEAISGVEQVLKKKKEKEVQMESTEATEEVVFMSEINSVKKKKKKDRESVQVDAIEGAIGVEAVSEMESVKKKKKKDKETVQVDAIEGAIEVEAVSEMESVKKKKNKKDKEKVLDQIEVNGLEKEVEQVIKKKMEGTEATEEVVLLSEIESVKKKKKKKDKEKDLIQVEAIEDAKEVEITLEVEAVKKKKKKKKEKEKKFVDQDSYEIAEDVESLGGKKGKFSGREEAVNLGNNESDINEIIEENNKNTKKRCPPEMEVVKRKKRKHKKEISEANEIDLTENCTSSSTNGLQENDQSNTNGDELASEEGSIKKKKKKKKKEEKEILSENEETRVKKRKHSSKKKNSESGGEIQDVLDSSSPQTKNKEISTDKLEKKRKQKFLENSEKDEEKKAEKANNNNSYGKTMPRTDKNNYARQGYNYSFNRSNPRFSQRSFGGTINNFNLPSNHVSLDIRSSNILENNLTYPRYNLGFNFNNFNPLSNISNFNLQNNNVLNLLNFLILNSYYNNALAPVNNCASEVPNHKRELMGEKNADKLYHGLNRTQRVSRLLQMSDFSGFKGSNLLQLLGYGIPQGGI